MRADRWDSSKPMTSPLYIKRHPNSKIAKFLDAELEAQQAVPAAETTPVFGPPYGHAARQKFAFETETKKTARAKSQQSRMRYKTAAVELPTHGSRILHSSESSRFDSRKPRAGNSSPEPVRVQATEEECTNLSGFSSSEAKIEALPLDEAVLDPEPDYGHLTRSDGDTVLCGPWTTIYRNSHNKLKLKVPDPGVVEWRFRLRVSNKSSEGGGWSPWGPPLYAHALSHPDLFDSQTTSLSTVLSVGGGSASPQNASIHKTHPLNVAHKYHPQSHVSCAPSLSTPLDAPSSDREAPRDVFFIEGYQSLHNDLNGTVLAPPAAAEAIVGEDHRAYSERSTVTSDSNARIANALPAEGGAIPSPPVGDGSRQTHSADASVRSSRSDSRSRSLNRDTAVGETGEYSGAGGTHDARRQSAKT